jgi:hypothetical protein
MATGRPRDDDGEAGPDGDARTQPPAKRALWAREEDAHGGVAAETGTSASGHARPVSRSRSDMQIQAAFQAAAEVRVGERARAHSHVCTRG